MQTVECVSVNWEAGNASGESIVPVCKLDSELVKFTKADYIVKSIDKIGQHPVKYLACYFR